MPILWYFTVNQVAFLEEDTGEDASLLVVERCFENKFCVLTSRMGENLEHFRFQDTVLDRFLMEEVFDCNVPDRNTSLKANWLYRHVGEWDAQSQLLCTITRLDFSCIVPLPCIQSAKYRIVRCQQVDACKWPKLGSAETSDNPGSAGCQQRHMLKMRQSLTQGSVLPLHKLRSLPNFTDWKYHSLPPCPAPWIWTEATEKCHSVTLSSLFSFYVKLVCTAWILLNTWTVVMCSCDQTVDSHCFLGIRRLLTNMGHCISFYFLLCIALYVQVKLGKWCFHWLLISLKWHLASSCSKLTLSSRAVSCCPGRFIARAKALQVELHVHRLATLRIPRWVTFRKQWTLV